MDGMQAIMISKYIRRILFLVVLATLLTSCASSMNSLQAYSDCLHRYESIVAADDCAKPVGWCRAQRETQRSPSFSSNADWWIFGPGARLRRINTEPGSHLPYGGAEEESEGFCDSSPNLTIGFQYPF